MALGELYSDASPSIGAQVSDCRAVHDICQAHREPNLRIDHEQFFASSED